MYHMKILLKHIFSTFLFYYYLLLLPLTKIELMSAVKYDKAKSIQKIEEGMLLVSMYCERASMVGKCRTNEEV